MQLGVSIPGQPWLGTVDGWDQNKAWLIKHCDIVGLPMPSWQRLQPVPGPFNWPEFDGIDRVVEQAHAAGLGIFLFPERAPAWACAQHAAKVGKLNVTPDDLSITGPWAQYLSEVLVRYGRKVQYLAPFNEPNFEYLGDAGTYIADCVRMTKTAAWVAQYVPGAPMLLVPNVLDSDAWGWSNWHYWLMHFLWGLEGYQPPKGVRLGCGFHPYGDLKEGRPVDGKVPRTQGALDLLAAIPTCLGQDIYLTELGTTFAANPVAHGSTLYDYSNFAADDVRQRDHMARGYAWATGRMEPKVRGKVLMAQQWVLRDRLQGHWKSGMLSPDGTPHSIVPLWEAARNR